MFVDDHEEDDDGADDLIDGPGGGGDPDEVLTGLPGLEEDDAGTRRCPSCGDAFIPTATRCPDCGVELVGGDEPVVYTFLMADDEAVETLERLMRETVVPYELADDELVVPGTHAVAVERVLDHLDEMLGLAVHHGAEVEVIELYDWEDQELDLLEAELRVARIPHGWNDEDGSLQVPATAIAEAEVVIDRVVHPDALELDDDAAVGSPELMSDLFLAADQLRKEPWNMQRVAELRSVVEHAVGSAAPYGVDQSTWNLAVTAAQDAVEASDDGAGEEEDVKGKAEQVRAILRPLV